METLPFFKASLRTVPAQPGRMTLLEVAELIDAISCIRVVCHHAFHRANGVEMPEFFAKHLAPLNSGKLTFAQTGRVLRLWAKWTHRFRTGDKVPDVSAVQGFLFALRDLYS